MSDYSINLANKNTYVVGIDDIIQSWNIILKTIPGSIPLQPEFGSNLYQYIDQPVNKVFTNMANTIIKDLERWEKRTKIKKVERTINESQVLIKIYGIYYPKNQNIISDITLIQNTMGGIGYMIIGSTFIIK